MEYNFDKVKGKIKEMYGTQNDFAAAIEMAPNTLSAKLNNQFEFSSNEISKAIELLEINSVEEAWNLFFTKKVEKNSTEK